MADDTPTGGDYLTGCEPTPPELGVVDYRENPSAGQVPTQEAGQGDGYDDPNNHGTAVSPYPDNGIHGYDMPSELGSYDQMSLGIPAAIPGYTADLDRLLAWERGERPKA